MVGHADVGGISVCIAGHAKGAEQGGPVIGLDLCGKRPRTICLDERASPGYALGECQCQWAVAAAAGVVTPNERVAAGKTGARPAARGGATDYGGQAVRSRQTDGNAHSLG